MFSNPLTAEYMRMDIIRRENISRKKMRKDDNRPDEVSSIYHSKVWKEKVINSRFLYVEPRNVVIGLSSDGFVPFKRSKHSIWPITIVFLNLPESIRTKPQNLGLVGVIDGPNKPKNFQIFLHILVDELLDLYNNGIEVTDTSSSNRMFNIKAMLLFTVADLQG
jgi:hypothetical protein